MLASFSLFITLYISTGVSVQSQYTDCLTRKEEEKSPVACLSVWTYRDLHSERTAYSFLILQDGAVDVFL